MASSDSISISPPDADPLSTSSADNHSHAHPHSLQSPLTPAAVSESNNGGPSMRWKSYTATKHREIPATECTNDRSTVASPPNLIPPDIMNSKGKLVINLCGIPRSVMKQSSVPATAASSSSSYLKTKGTLEDKDGLDIMKMKVCEANASSTEGVKLPQSLGEDPQNDMKLLNEVQCPASEQEVLKTKSPNNVQVSGLARKMCRRIEKIRRSVMNSEKTSSRSSQTIAAVFMSQSKKKKKKHSLQTNGSLQSELNVETNENILTIGKVQEGDFNGGLEDPLVEENLDASRSTKDSSLTKDQLGQFDNINGKFTASRSTRDTALAKDHLEQYNNINVKFDASMYDNHELDDGIVKGMSVNRELGDGIISKETKEDDIGSKDVMAKSFSKVRRNAKSDGGGFSETSKLDMKEQTVLETLLRDEPAGYSSAGGSERSRSYKSGSKAMKAELSFHGDEDEDDDDESADAESERKGDAEGNQSDEYEDPDTYTSQSREYDGEEEFDGNGLSGSTQRTTNGRGAYFSEQVIPSVLCDAEGNMWHIGKRAEQARGARKPRELPVSDEKKLHGSSNCKQESIEVLKHNDLHILPPSSLSSIAPFNHLIETSWKWPSDSDYTINPIGDVSSRSMVAKERSVFVGCIPDGTENLEAVLHNLMGEFLERFDFAPITLGQIRLVKIGKDYAFLELATEKVAHIVLAANQLDVFEWGVNGFHFNIEGCKGTHTSVRPLIEYMPLKPGRIIFVGNIPKSHWKKEYLEVFFTRLLQASDGPAESTFVTSVFLLPESCDAYVELSSEMMADSVIFKCTKVPQLLKDIGEDVFICRDPSSVPLMSKHKGGICPQRSLFVGISSPCQGFKIDAVRKIFEEILPVISRETNQPGYLEYISVQPGKDYAFFQFNSEAIVDAVMDEYIEHTQIFTSNGNSLSYIILRPPGYVRPGAKYSCGSNYSGGKSKGMFTHGQFKRVDRKKNMVKQPGSIPLIPRRFGDEPAKKADCVMSIGASPLPLASWNGLSSAGAVATHPDCMIVIEGLPKGLSYKLLRGALNELLERSLRGSGLLEVGLLLLRYLDRDGDLDVVASLPSAKFVRVLLSMRKIFTIAGNEVRLLPKGGAKRVNWKGNPADCLRSQGDLSCLTDDEGNMQREASRYPQRGLSYPIKRKKGHSKGSIYSHLISDRTVRRKGFGLVAKEEQYEEESTRNSNISSQCKKGNKQENKVRLQQRWSGLRGRYKALSSVSRPIIVKQPTKVITVSHQQNHGISPRVKMLGVRESSMMSRPRCRSILRVNGSGQKAIEEVPNEILRIVSAGGKRKIQSLDTQPVLGNKGTTPVFGMANKRRRLLQQTPAFTQNRLSIRNRSSFC